MQDLAVQIRAGSYRDEIILEAYGIVFCATEIGCKMDSIVNCGYIFGYVSNLRIQQVSFGLY